MMYSVPALMNSATTEFSTELANSSGQLGRNLMDHMMGSGASGIIPGHEDRQQIGNRPNRIYVPRFRNVKEKDPKFVRGYGFQGGGSRDDWSRGSEVAAFGADFKHMLRQPGAWRFLPLPVPLSVFHTPTTAWSWTRTRSTRGAFPP
jgi:hypothetical protein